MRLTMGAKMLIFSVYIDKVGTLYEKENDIDDFDVYARDRMCDPAGTGCRHGTDGGNRCHGGF